MILISLIAGITGYLMYGILMVLASLIFQLLTLPVEFDASNRALKQLIQLNIVDEKELDNSKEVLSAAAMTYVASVLSSLLSLIRLILMYKDNKDR